MRKLAIFVASLLLPVLCPADVLIFKGTYKGAAPTITSGQPKLEKCYVAVGDNQGLYNIVILHYGQRDGVKQAKQEPLHTSVPSEFVTPAGKEHTALAYAEYEAPGASFRNTAIFLRGENRTLTLRNTPNVITRAFPKILTGRFNDAFVSLASNNNRYADVTLNVTFDAFRTQAANNANKTLSATMVDLVGELSASGYTLK